MAAVGCRDGRVRVVSTRPGTGLMHTLGDDVPGVTLACCTALRWRPEQWKSSDTKNVLLVARVSFTTTHLFPFLSSPLPFPSLMVNSAAFFAI
jgi:hypothetical protein